MTAQQPHQAMDYVLLEILDRSPQLLRLIMPRVVVLARVHWPGEKNQLVFVIHISISSREEPNHLVENGLMHVAANEMWVFCVA